MSEFKKTGNTSARRRRSIDGFLSAAGLQKEQDQGLTEILEKMPLDLLDFYAFQARANLPINVDELKRSIDKRKEMMRLVILFPRIGFGEVVTFLRNNNISLNEFFVAAAKHYTKDLSH